jgi:hypothetical protein
MFKSAIMGAIALAGVSIAATPADARSRSSVTISIGSGGYYDPYYDGYYAPYYYGDRYYDGPRYRYAPRYYNHRAYKRYWRDRQRWNRYQHRRWRNRW